MLRTHDPKVENNLKQAVRIFDRLVSFLEKKLRKPRTKVLSK
jgi:hypothetical protein